jgi:hypothetical protein
LLERHAALGGNHVATRQAVAGVLLSAAMTATSITSAAASEAQMPHSGSVVSLLVANDSLGSVSISRQTISPTANVAAPIPRYRMSMSMNLR